MLQLIYSATMLPYHDLLIIISEYLATDTCSLLMLCQASSQTHIAAATVLYKNVVLYSIQSIPLFCRTILTGSHSLPPLVKNLWIGPASHNRFPGIVAHMPSLKATLRLLPHLQGLTLTPMAKSFGDLFAALLDSEFCLDNLKASYHIQHSFVQFLQSQPSIRRLYLHDPDTEPPRSYSLVSNINQISVKERLLPNLELVSADPRVLASLVPGRPVSHVEIVVGSYLSGEKHIMASLIASLAQSTVPIVSIVHIPKTVRIHFWGPKFLQRLQETHISETLRSLTVSLPQIMRPLLAVSWW